MYYHYYYRSIGRCRCRIPGRFVQAGFFCVDNLQFNLLQLMDAGSLSIVVGRTQVRLCCVDVNSKTPC